MTEPPSLLFTNNCGISETCCRPRSRRALSYLDCHPELALIRPYPVTSGTHNLLRKLESLGDFLNTLRSAGPDWWKAISTSIRSTRHARMVAVAVRMRMPVGAQIQQSDVRCFFSVSFALGRYKRFQTKRVIVLNFDLLYNMWWYNVCVKMDRVALHALPSRDILLFFVLLRIEHRNLLHFLSMMPQKGRNFRCSSWSIMDQMSDCSLDWRVFLCRWLLYGVVIFRSARFLRT